jgi:hypothetical protein
MQHAAGISIDYPDEAAVKGKDDYLQDILRYEYNDQKVAGKKQKFDLKNEISSGHNCCELQEETRGRISQSE